MNQKGFIIPLLAIILIIAAGIGGYVLSLKNHSSALIILKSKCREDGKKVHDEQVKRYYDDTFIGDPQYTYNEHLNTCLYAQRYIEGANINALIKDIYTNRSIIEYVEYIGGKQLEPVSKDDFNKKYRELFQTTTNLL